MFISDFSFPKSALVPVTKTIFFFHLLIMAAVTCSSAAISLAAILPNYILVLFCGDTVGTRSFDPYIVFCKQFPFVHGLRGTYRGKGEINGNLFFRRRALMPARCFASILAPAISSPAGLCIHTAGNIRPRPSPVSKMPFQYGCSQRYGAKTGVVAQRMVA